MKVGIEKPKGCFGVTISSTDIERPVCVRYELFGTTSCFETDAQYVKADLELKQGIIRLTGKQARTLIRLLEYIADDEE